MDFLNDFLVSYGQVIDDKVIFIAHSIVQRIQLEISKGIDGGCGSIIIQKMLNILKQIT
jgi:hypothetical protein